MVSGDAASGIHHAFRTAPNHSIDPATDDLGTLGGTESGAYGINASGQVVGWANTSGAIYHAFRTVPNSAINPTTDDLGTLGGTYSLASGINASGQVVGWSLTGTGLHAFRTAADSAINPATDDLGPFGAQSSAEANAINDFGQVVGWLSFDGVSYHAFRTAPNEPINPTNDVLDWDGDSAAMGINNYGEAVGYSGAGNNLAAVLYSTGLMHNLNDLIPADSGYHLSFATGINDAGQIAVRANGGMIYPHGDYSLLLTPIYKAFVQPPINADGSSVFSAKRGVVPVKFAVTQYGTQPSCTLPATIAITRASGGTLTPIGESDPNFQITGCQYHYNLATGSLGAC